MFVRVKKNKSGSISVQIIEKKAKQYKVIESIGVARTRKEQDLLKEKAKKRLKELTPQQSFSFFSEKQQDEQTIEKFLIKNDENIIVTNIGPELVLGKIFDNIGLNQISEIFFRHITLARLTYPVSKLKTQEYLRQHHGIETDISAIYRFLDRFHEKYKTNVEQIIYEYSRSVLGKIHIVFYDMTTLYFETEDEDDLRKIGFSKDGKFQCPQIMLGLLVGEDGYPIGYDLFEGNTFEGHTLIPTIEAMQKKYSLPKPIIIADSGLLSKNNLIALESQGYKFILGARIKNETAKIKKEILEKTNNLEDNQSIKINKADGTILIVGFSQTRSKKDKYNREKGVEWLKKKITGGKLTKQSINNRGYNKFLTIENEIKVFLDTKKINKDKAWDGLKGYITNTEKLTNETIIANYNHLWKIEKAFRISKTDLRIRPIYHRKRNRIESHLTIAFAAYAIYKELERQLNIHKIDISPAKAIELTKTIFQLEFFLPEQQKNIKIFNKLSDLQKLILKI